MLIERNILCVLIMPMICALVPNARAEAKLPKMLWNLEGLANTCLRLLSGHQSSIDVNF